MFINLLIYFLRHFFKRPRESVVSIKLCTPSFSYVCWTLCTRVRSMFSFVWVSGGEFFVKTGRILYGRFLVDCQTWGHPWVTPKKGRTGKPMLHSHCWDRNCRILSDSYSNKNVFRFIHCYFFIVSKSVFLWKYDK